MHQALEDPETRRQLGWLPQNKISDIFSKSDITYRPWNFLDIFRPSSLLDAMSGFLPIKLRQIVARVGWQNLNYAIDFAAVAHFPILAIPVYLAYFTSAFLFEDVCDVLNITRNDQAHANPFIFVEVVGQR